MKRIVSLLIYITLGVSETILIPADYSTIQEGIDASQDGDTVLVAEGTYIENLILNKSILLASHAIYDDLTNWVEYDDQFTSEWQITNDHINNTIIDGSKLADSVYASVILITPDSETCITPEVMGFTIQNGEGTEVPVQMMEAMSTKSDWVGVFWQIYQTPLFIITKYQSKKYGIGMYVKYG